MKFTAAILVLAAAVMAAPYDNPPPKPTHTPTPPPPPGPDSGAGAGKCSNNQKTFCCDSMISTFSCSLSLLNLSNCGGGKTYCCNANTPLKEGQGGVHILEFNLGNCNRVF